jgi:hypothetical protein
MKFVRDSIGGDQPIKGLGTNRDCAANCCAVKRAAAIVIRNTTCIQIRDNRHRHNQKDGNDAEDGQEYV